MDRYAYFSHQSISGDELKGSYAFAVKTAKEQNASLTVLVNNIGTSSKFLDNIFTEVEKNKLKRYQSISKSGLSIQLKSQDGFKEHESYGVVLAIHSSPKAIAKIEANEQIKAVVAVAEINNYEEHLTNWKIEKNVLELKNQNT